MANNNQSPCLTCVKVKDPSNCENKTCRAWQSWFLRRWRLMQEFVGIEPVPSKGEDE